MSVAKYPVVGGATSIVGGLTGERDRLVVPAGRREQRFVARDHIAGMENISTLLTGATMPS